MSGDVSWLMRKEVGDRPTITLSPPFVDNAPALMLEGLDRNVLNGVCGDRKWADMIIIHVGPRGFV